MPESQVMTLKEAASFMRVSQKTLRERARDGRVPGQRVGREWRFLKRALEEWLAQGQAANDGSGAVSEPAAQLYLPSVERTARPAKAGFGDTAFTKNRDAPVHRWVPWVAGYSASFVAEILDRELSAKNSLALLDPFAGVGTTLVEGVKRNCDVVGFEINPYAALASEVKIHAVSHKPQTVRDAANRLADALGERLRNPEAAPKSRPPAGFRTRDPFFSPLVERQVLFLKDLILEEKRAWLRKLMLVAMGSLMVGVSNYSYEPSLGRRVSAGKEPIFDADVPRIMRDKLLLMAEDIAALRADRNGSERPVARVFNADYLNTAAGHLGASSIDVLITSPPYLNNYHYVRNTRPQMFWLDFAAEAADLRQLETDSFGKFWQTVRGEEQIDLDFDDPELAERIDDLRALNAEKGQYGGPGWANYAATYFNDCRRFCEVTAEVMKPGGLVVVVIGNNILQGIEFKTDEYFARIAERAGFRLEGIHVVRKKRTGSSIVNSSVRAGVVKKKTALYETAVELRKK
jgi:excisionase family DNA binding protein